MLETSFGSCLIMETDLVNLSSTNNLIDSDALQNKENICNILENAVQSKGDNNVDLLSNILRQCEFYFSDANILKDQFLLNQVKGSKDGWIKLVIIEKFKKIKQLSECHDTVLKALSSSAKLEVSEDGLSIRRRDPLPQWDPKVYRRSIIISDLPEGVKASVQFMNEILSSDNKQPLLTRICLPERKVPFDLKRSQSFHPQLGTKLCVVAEFDTPELAVKAINLACTQWPTAYIKLLSQTSYIKGDKKNKKKKGENKENASDDSGGRPAFLLAKRSSPEVAKVIHIREPTAPPEENSSGFTPGWRAALQLEHVMDSVTAALASSRCALINDAIVPVAEGEPNTLESFFSS